MFEGYVRHPFLKAMLGFPRGGWLQMRRPASLWSTRLANLEADSSVVTYTGAIAALRPKQWRIANLILAKMGLSRSGLAQNARGLSTQGLGKQMSKQATKMYQGRAANK